MPMLVPFIAKTVLLIVTFTFPDIIFNAPLRLSVPDKSAALLVIFSDAPTGIVIFFIVRLSFKIV